ncbi:glucoamylase [Luteitalea sp. TBR-22]|uniref:glycoside hydrolase family 15 protein n=1 Tax=Luteitalea sp. TBR-22 TaxID=2802971 RepID=UPI001AF7D3F5|nr:glycoside hydrolase family 15 protein [Luteitalea sp. TBR-22]BCS34975.1 glucoamylase [Luteitalea sp. TBR-22]
MSRPLEDYALIGDCESAALVSRDGSIDWLCWPRFDSDACFAALLGTEEHGRWLLAPEGDVATTRRYLPDTLMLETTHETAEGTVVVLDFMPPRGRHPDLVRQVRGVRGRVRMRTELVLRFDYGRTVPWVSRLPDGRTRAVAGPHMVVLQAPAVVHGEGLRTVGYFDVGAGDEVALALVYGASHLPLPPPVDVAHVRQASLAFWHKWVAPHRTGGDWADLVSRSLITLKALTYAPTGGIVAAPTTSLPEQLGGSRNWDYRYCWLRDATLTLLALMNAGHMEEAAAWRAWLLRAAAGAPSQVQIMYGLAGERRLTEAELSWLPGYADSRPVRLGNAAHDQLQLDVFGEVLDALHQARLGGLESTPAAWALERALVDHVTTIWDQPDEGIWEVRGPRRHFTHSRVMAWVALDRGIKSAERFGLPGDLPTWRQVRQAIHDDVCAKGFNRALGTFVQAYGEPWLDASLLLLPTMGFLPATDPRVGGTIAAVERHLLRDGFVLRYDTSGTEDGLPPGEGAFLACSLWLADAYTLQGRIDEARLLFERVVGIANDVGLLAEEYDPALGRLVGNFPQAFSHIALVNTAHNLARATKPARQRAS